MKKVNLNNFIPVRIGKQEIIVEVARTPSKLKKGLKGRDDIGNGMLLDFTKSDDYPITMKGVNQDLSLVFVNEDRVVESVQLGKSNSKKDYSSGEKIRFVLELPVGKHKIKKGDKLGISIIETPKDGDIHVLDTHGDKQQVISGNNRIFSIPHTKELLKLAEKREFKKLGEKVFEILEIQDNQKQQFVKK